LSCEEAEKMPLCELCEINFESDECLSIHCQTRKHQYNFTKSLGKNVVSVIEYNISEKNFLQNTDRLTYKYVFHNDDDTSSNLLQYLHKIYVSLKKIFDFQTSNYPNIKVDGKLMATFVYMKQRYQLSQRAHHAIKDKQYKLHDHTFGHYDFATIQDFDEFLNHQHAIITDQQELFDAAKEKEALYYWTVRNISRVDFNLQFTASSFSEEQEQKKFYSEWNNNTQDFNFIFYNKE